jgi:hypothetical protein
MQRRLVKAEVWNFLKSFQNSTNQSIILIQGLSKLKMFVTTGAGGCGENTEESGKIEKVMANKFRKICEQNKEVNNMAKEEPETDKKGVNRENQREVKVISYLCTSQFRGC